MICCSSKEKKFESKLSNRFINAVSQAGLAICRGVSYDQRAEIPTV